MAPRKDLEGFATADDLGPVEAYSDIDLPVLGKKVRVRLLSTPDAAELSYLPDLLGFSMMAAKYQDEDERKELDARKFIVENLKYQATLAHVAVMKPSPKIPAATLCAECSLTHPPSLWTRAQASRLDQSDLQAISGAAVGIQALMRLRPFSTDETPSTTPEPASTGA